MCLFIFFPFDTDSPYRWVPHEMFWFHRAGLCHRTRICTGQFLNDQTFKLCEIPGIIPPPFLCSLPAQQISVRMKLCWPMLKNFIHHSMRYEALSISAKFVLQLFQRRITLWPQEITFKANWIRPWVFIPSSVFFPQISAIGVAWQQLYE